MALTSRVSRAVEIIVSLTDKISAPAKKIANNFKQIGNSATTSFKKVRKEADKSTVSVKKVRNAVGSLYGRLISLAGGITLGAIVNIASGFEKLSISLRTVIGDAEKADEAFSAIREFARTVPLGVGELTNAFVKLKSRGLDPSIEALESYGNSAAALGKTLDQFVEAVADAVTFQFERLREFGIVAAQSADTVAFTFQGTTTTVKKNAADIERYLRSIGSTQFAGGLVAQMDTISWATSNLRDAFNGFAVALSEAGLAGAIKTVYRELADFISSASEGIKDNADVIEPTLDALAKTFVGFANGVRIAFNAIQITIKSLSLGINETLIAINRGLAAISFGDVAKGYSKTADEFEAVSLKIRQSIAQDQKDFAIASDRLASLFSENEKVIENSNKKIDKDLSDRGSIIGKFVGLLDELRGVSEKTADELRVTDTFGPIQDAIDAIDAGNFDQALSKTDELVQMIRDMSKAGNVSSATLQNLALRVQDLATEATRKKGLGETLLGDENEMQQRIDELRQQVGLNPITADLEVNTAEAEATIQALQQTPVTIPIQFVPVNNQNDIIYQEVLKRGDNG